MKKRIATVGAVAVLVIAAVAGYTVVRGAGKTPQDRIVVSGNIELNEVVIAFKTPGLLVERTVNEGDAVTKGQVLAKLDTGQLAAQRDKEKAGLAVAQSQATQAGTAVEWQRATTTADIEQRRADLAAAQAKLAELRAGSRPQEKQDAQAAVESAQAEAERARKDFERAQVLHRNDDISTQAFDQARSRTNSAEAALKSARERLAMVLEGPRVEQINAQKATVEKMRAALKMAEANTIEVVRRQDEVTTRKAEIARSKASIAAIDTQLSDTVAISPIDGVVLVKSADVGEVLAAGTPVLTVGDIDRPWLRGYVNETDLGKVKLGSPVKVTTDSFPGKVYNGKITFISSEAEFTPKQIQTKQERVKLVYRVKIEVENPNRELKSNMPADAEIMLVP